MATPDSTHGQAKISQKLVVRTAGLLFVLAGLFGGFRYYQSLQGDFDFGSSNSAGLLAAIETQGDGSRAVIIKQDGTVVGTKSWTSQATDRDLAWSPDGKFLYFVSDRLESTPHIYRWNPDQDDADPRTVGKRGRSNPTFPPAGTPDAVNMMLIVSGGTVQSLDAKKKATPQVLPPIGAEVTKGAGDDSGTEGQFSAIYGELGNSFRIARWCKGSRYIVAVMRRDNGEVLVIQDMTPKDGRFPRPVPIAAGDHFDFDISAKDGSVVYSVLSFRFPDPKTVPPEFIKNNRVVIPFRHGIFAFDPDKGGLPPIVVSNNDGGAFGSLALSPDGETIIAVGGIFDPSAGFSPKGLLGIPNRPNGDQSASRLAEGEIFDPAWSPDGAMFAYARRSGPGKRDIITVRKDGSNERNVTGGRGNFSSPKFSPQVKAGA